MSYCAVLSTEAHIFKLNIHMNRLKCNIYGKTYSTTSIVKENVRKF